MSKKISKAIKVSVCLLYGFCLFLFLPDLVFLVSWYTKYDLYDILFFIKEKPFLENDSFAYNVSELMKSYWYVSIILGIVLAILVIVDLRFFKEKRHSVILIYSFLILTTLIVAYFILKYHNLLLFYDSPANDLPWDYRELFWELNQNYSSLVNWIE